jgi:hypothetical protein
VLEVAGQPNVSELQARDMRVENATALGEADLVIADVSGGNPWVFFQAGLAEGLKRETLYLAQFAEGLPRGTAELKAIIYAGDIAYLKRKLAERLSLSGESQEPGLTGSDAKAQFEGIFGDLLKQHGYRHVGRVELENSTTFVLHDQEMDLALVQELARRAKAKGLRIKLL